MKIRSYQPGDENQILELDWILFPDPWNKRDLDNWYWKHTGNNPAGNATIYLMEHEGKIIVHFAAIPYRLRVLGKDVLGSHSIGSMVLPEYQGKGLIKFVADKLFEDIVTKDMAFSYGFPNDLAYDLHKKLMGYSDVIMVDTLEKETRVDGPSGGKNVSADFEFLPITQFDHSVDALWDQGKDDYKISVIRDAAFLNWRYLERPDQKYHAFGVYENNILVGYVILKLYQDGEILRGHIVDIYSLSGRGDVAAYLLGQSDIFFVDNNTNVVSTWMIGAAIYRDILLENGFKSVRPRPLICRLNCDQEKYRPMLDGANWYFTMGDTTEIF
ncbi:MAG: GNAT family N-acetyltransferase [Candidatus Omnitrophica bacterium]|nr:GNAT family N-acetyltransferase [Candidatus Omnitrophota bacterium]